MRDRLSINEAEQLRVKGQMGSIGRKKNGVVSGHFDVVLVVPFCNVHATAAVSRRAAEVCGVLLHGGRRPRREPGIDAALQSPSGAVVGNRLAIRKVDPIVSNNCSPSADILHSGVALSYAMSESVAKRTTIGTGSGYTSSTGWMRDGTAQERDPGYVDKVV